MQYSAEVGRAFAIVLEHATFENIVVEGMIGAVSMWRRHTDQRAKAIDEALRIGEFRPPVSRQCAMKSSTEFVPTMNESLASPGANAYRQRRDDLMDDDARTARQWLQTRSATYVLLFSEQNGKMTYSSALSPGPKEQCASRYTLESSPVFGQVTGGKQALKTDQFPVTPYAVNCGKKSICFSSA